MRYLFSDMPGVISEGLTLQKLVYVCVCMFCFMFVYIYLVLCLCMYVLFYVCVETGFVD